MTKRHDFIEKLSQADLDGAADHIEDYAKSLVGKVASSAIRKVEEIVFREFDYNNRIETNLARSELLKLNVAELSEVFAGLLVEHPEMLDKLRKIIKALSNFYAYYSGEGLD